MRLGIANIGRVEPTTTGSSTWFPRRPKTNVCPGCGRCQVCGAGGHYCPGPYQPYRPYWSITPPNYTYC